LASTSAQQDADGAARGDRGAPDAHRLVALRTLGEQHGHQRQRGRGEQGGAEALNCARGDEPAGALGEPAGQRCGREQDQASDEQTTTSEHVGDTTAEEQEAAEHEHVRVDDPRQVVRREPEVRPDRRQRDVDDRRVEHDDELGRGEQRQREPLVGAAARHAEFLSRKRITTIPQ